MKEILEAKLGSVRKSLNDAYQQCDQHGVTHYSAQEELLEHLLDKCIHIECSYDAHDYYESRYDNDDEYWSIDEWSDHLNELEYYKQQEIDNLYDVFNQHSWWIGKNVLHTDSMWFTSDEIEAFRTIWQRRISA
jgi:hypothetical protein